MTAESLSTAAAIALSLACSYLPGLSDWYTALDGTRKRLVMLALLALVSGAAFGLACSPFSTASAALLPGEALTCDPTGLYSLLRAFLAALIANQATFLISPRNHVVRQPDAQP